MLASTRKVLCALLLLSRAAFAQSLQPHLDTPDPSLHFSVGQAQVTLTAAKAGIFRMNLAYSSSAKSFHSVFLNPELGDDPCRKIHQGTQQGIATDQGALLVDPTTGRWTLENASHAIEASGLIWKHLIAGEKPEPDLIHFQVDCATDLSFAAYGSGNGTDSLIPTQASAGVGNGHAVIPYYWSNQGYSLFALGSDDDEPAQWSLSSDKRRVTWSVPGQMAEFYLAPVPTLREASPVYAQISGAPLVPPEWVFGYLQSRWGWKSKAYIDETLKKFETDHLPVDAFIFDFECYTSTPDYTLKAAGVPDFHDFTWNPALFPQPAKQIAGMLDRGVHTVPIRKPRLGDSTDLTLMRAKGWGLSADPHGWAPDLRGFDFRIPEARAWYETNLKTMLDDGVAGWWDDEGESFYTKYYYWNLAQSEARATYRPGTRHWSLNRAFEPGLQRLGGTVWSGDIHSNWATLASTPATLLNWGLAGMPFSTCDIGGFADNPSPQLLTRWMEAGVFFPMMRAHSVLSEKPHFPWLFGQPAEDAIRKALDLRYRLIPYYYSLAHEAHETGVPMMRPLAMAFPADPKCADLTSQWLMGDGLMAAPILSPADSRAVYFPAGKWYDFDGPTAYEGGHQKTVQAKLDQIPVYVRAGSIIALAPVLQHTSQFPGGPLELRIYPGKDADFTLVQDDGASTDYLQNHVLRTSFHWDDAHSLLSWKCEGDYTGGNVFRKAFFVFPGGKQNPDFLNPIDASGLAKLDASIVTKSE